MVVSPDEAIGRCSPPPEPLTTYHDGLTARVKALNLALAER